MYDSDAGQMDVDASDDALDEESPVPRQFRAQSPSSGHMQLEEMLEPSNQNYERTYGSQDDDNQPRNDDRSSEPGLPLAGTLDNFEYLDKEDESDVEDEVSEEDVQAFFQEYAGDEWEEAYHRFCKLTSRFLPSSGSHPYYRVKAAHRR